MNDSAIAQDVRIDVAALTQFVERIFAVAGCTADESALIAQGLVRANLFGHDSHGVGLIPLYLGNLELGLVRPGQTVRVVADHGSIVGLDGQKGFGQSIGGQAMRIAIERARATGLCMIGLSNTHHLARIGHWAEQCADAGLASVHFVNVLSRPLVAPWGGLDARLATNPFCVGVPHSPHPLVLDFATSMIAMGKARVALDAGESLADGLVMDSRGQPSNDPAVMFADPPGALMPFAQHKGFALSVMCELLGGALSGGIVQDRDLHPAPLINNMLSLVFAPDKLCSAADLDAQVMRLAAWLKASPTTPGGTGVALPGEPERATAAERTRLGIPLPPRTREALIACAGKVGTTAAEMAN
jgi:hydroxycarboxylate dehydrogenase B